MDGLVKHDISASLYDRSQCDVGVVHIGFGAFHRAHQAVYIDRYMDETNDLRWGIAAVNLRPAESQSFAQVAKEVAHNDGYYLKSISAADEVSYQKIRSHVQFLDWHDQKQQAEALLSLDSVKLVTITVTEGGYYTDPVGDVDFDHPLMAAELKGDEQASCYAYLRVGLMARYQAGGAPLTIACCDNIRQNGKLLQRNLITYLSAFGDEEFVAWVQANIAFPCSMVDRITPRSSTELADEFSMMLGKQITSPIMCEDFIQWVLSDQAKNDMPDLAKVGVTVTSDVDPYEETKIRVLNGGHTATAYLAALSEVDTFDAAMRHPELKEHFEQFEREEVLKALSIKLPFSKEAYLEKTATRFGNKAIGDTVARICADGMAKFPIFIRPTLEGCLAQSIEPIYAIRSIASWYVFARHVAAGNIPFDYIEPSWDALSQMIEDDSFFTSQQLWGTIPETYPKFIELLRQEIAKLEAKWPV